MSLRLSIVKKLRIQTYPFSIHVKVKLLIKPYFGNEIKHGFKMSFECLPIFCRDHFEHLTDHATLAQQFFHPELPQSPRHAVWC